MQPERSETPSFPVGDRGRYKTLDGKGILEVNFDDIAPLFHNRSLFTERERLCSSNAEQAARIEQRRRQWDLEASQSIKE